MATFNTLKDSLNMEGKFYFKFYSFRNHDLEMIHNLRNNKIFAPSLSSFNDPFEDIWYDANIQDEYRKNADSEFLQRINRRGVFCMSSSEDENFPISSKSLLMWAHYSGAHKGFCVMYSNNILETPNQEFKRHSVTYTNDLPESRRSDNYDCRADTDIEDIIYTKSSEWAYEQEYRLVFSRVGNYEIPQNCVKAIFCGCRISPIHKTYLREVAKDLACDFFTLRLCNDKFLLAIDNKDDKY